jgi:hypothetical protein
MNGHASIIGKSIVIPIILNTYTAMHPWICKIKDGHAASLESISSIE